MTKYTIRQKLASVIMKVIKMEIIRLIMMMLSKYNKSSMSLKIQNIIRKPSRSITSIYFLLKIIVYMER